MGVEDREVEVCSLATQFHDMVAKEAHKVWRLLPAHTKVWVSFEDIMQDGMMKLVTEIIPKWDNSRGKLSTIITCAIRNYFDDEYTMKFGVRQREIPGGRTYSHQRRNEGKTIAIEDLAIPGDRRTCWDVLHSLSHDLVYSNVLKDCWVVPTLLGIYKDASGSLRLEIKYWFLTNERLRLDTPRFCVACVEFRKLAYEHSFGVEDCRHLLGSVKCLDQLSRQLLLVPSVPAPLPVPALAYA